MTIIATIIVLGVLIFVHELGHFWAAKSVGVRVERFSIGLGPRVTGFERGGTEYILAAIPLGGYVKMGGMNDEMMERIEGGSAPDAEGGAESTASTSREAGGPAHGDTEIPLTSENPSEEGGRPPRRPRDDDYDSKPVWARAWVISAGVLMNMAFAFVAYVVIGLGWGSPVPDTLQVGETRAELLEPGLEALAEIPTGAEIVRIGEHEPRHWGDVQEAFRSLPAGPVELSFRNPDGVVSLDLPDDDEARVRLLRGFSHRVEPVIAGIMPGSPADRAGIEEGDRILAVDGSPVELWEHFTRMIRERPETETVLRLERGGGEITRNVTPNSVRGEDLDTGEVITIGQIGAVPVAPGTAYQPLAPLDALRSGYDDTVWVTGLILGFLRDLVTGQMSPRNLGSIVTIGEASGQAAAQGIPVFLGFMAFFSVNLAILNLLPIPILDGGHLVFLAIEAVRGKPVSVEQRMRWSQVGFVVLIGIMVLALGNDFLRLFGL